MILLFGDFGVGERFDGVGGFGAGVSEAGEGGEDPGTGFELTEVEAAVGVGLGGLYPLLVPGAAEADDSGGDGFAVGAGDAAGELGEGGEFGGELGGVGGVDGDGWGFGAEVVGVGDYRAVGARGEGGEVELSLGVGGGFGVREFDGGVGDGGFCGAVDEVAGEGAGLLGEEGEGR